MTKPRKGNSAASTQGTDITLESLFEKLEKLEEKNSNKRVYINTNGNNK